MKKPYRDVKANTCETLSLLSLVAIATFSLAEAAFMSAGVEADGPNENHFQVLQWVEVVLLGFLPAAFLVSRDVCTPLPVVSLGGSCYQRIEESPLQDVRHL